MASSAPSARRSRRDAGQVTLEWIGALAVVAVVLASSAVAFRQGADEVNEGVTCLVRAVVGSDDRCAHLPDDVDLPDWVPDVDPTTDGGEPVPGPDGRPVGEVPESCDDVVYDHEALPGQMEAGQNPVYLRIGCRWYPVREQCRGLLDTAIEDGPWLAGLRPNTGHDIGSLLDCVGGRSGAPGEDQDAEDCRDTLPHTASEEPSGQNRIQVGCREYVVPEQCGAQWEAWSTRTVAGGSVREAALGTDLADCVTGYYEKAEPVCVVGSDKSITTNEVRVLWLKMSDSEGMLIEELGDGRWRVHVLQGEGIGVAAESPTKGNIPQGSLSYMDGVDRDDTYEFADEAAARDWVQWYSDYDDVRGKAKWDPEVGRWMEYRTPPAGRYQWMGGWKWVSDDRARELQEVLDREPAHKAISNATTDYEEVQVGIKGGRSGKKGDTSKGDSASGQGGPGGEFSYKAKMEVESRTLTDGGFAATYRATDEVAMALLLKLGGAKKFPAGLESAIKGELGGGWEKKANVTFSVVWNADGTVRQIMTSTSTQTLTNITNSSAGAEIPLPYGFGISGSGGGRVQQGEDAVVEHILNLDAHPELRDDVTPLVDELFPGGRDGELTDTPGITFEGTDDGGPEDGFAEASKQGVTRELSYDVEEKETKGEVNVTFWGMTLLGFKHSEVNTATQLTDSSLTVTDVDGVDQVVETAPMCNHRSVDPASYDYDDGPSHAGDARG